jgi:hypothetical protein
MEQEPSVRTFRDEHEREWEVRAIRAPLTERRTRLLPGDLASGWLLFMCGAERRRLAPLPPGWHVATDRQLGRWCADAMEAPPLPVRGDAEGEERGGGSSTPQD